MKYKISLLLLFSSLAAQTVAAQRKIAIAEEPSYIFGFTKHWAYPWYITKGDNGKFSSAEDVKIAAKDTAHLFYTASCSTNVQGGYEIRYCAASRVDGEIKISFADGLPAYASEYIIEITGDQPVFKPTIHYPEFARGQKITYTATACRLTLYQKDYRTSKTISGYLDATFDETVVGSSGKKVTKKHVLKGYFKTPVKSQLISNL